VVRGVIQRLDEWPTFAIFARWETAAVILPHTVSNAVAYPIILLMAIWFLLSIVALFFYFYRAWKRVGAVPNKAAYIAWLIIESAFALAAVAGIVWFFVTPS
jgi:hypothetical protein